MRSSSCSRPATWCPRSCSAGAPKNRAEARKTIEALRDPGSIRVPDFVLDDVVREAAKGPIARLAAASDGMEKFVLEGRLAESNHPSGGLDLHKNEVAPSRPDDCCANPRYRRCQRLCCDYHVFTP